jgi:hypothetical protein
VLNVTVAAPSAAGLVTVWPSGQPRQVTSNLNFRKGQDLANLVMVPVGADGKVNFYVEGPQSSQLIADVAGYVVGGAATAPGAFNSLAPSRVLDTRKNLGASGPVAPKTEFSVQMLGQNGIPASGVSAVVLNVTVAAPSAAGLVTVWPSGQPRQVTSNLNFRKGQDLANLVMVPVGADGKVNFYVEGPQSSQLIADVAGYIIGE